MVEHWWRAKHERKADILARQSTGQSSTSRLYGSSGPTPPKSAENDPLHHPDHAPRPAAGPHSTHHNLNLAERYSHLPHQVHFGGNSTPPIDSTQPQPILHMISQAPARGPVYHPYIKALPTPPPHVDMTGQSFTSSKASRAHEHAAQLPYKPSTMCHKASQQVVFGKECTGEVRFCCNNNAPHHGPHVMVCVDTKIKVAHTDPALIQSTTRGSRCPWVMTLKCERERKNHHALNGAHLVYHAAEGFFYVKTPGDKDFHRLHQHKP